MMLPEMCMLWSILWQRYKTFHMSGEGLQYSQVLELLIPNKLMSMCNFSHYYNCCHLRFTRKDTFKCYHAWWVRHVGLKSSRGRTRFHAWDQWALLACADKTNPYKTGWSTALICICWHLLVLLWIQPPITYHAYAWKFGIFLPPRKSLEIFFLIHIGYSNFKLLVHDLIWIKLFSPIMERNDETNNMAASKVYTSTKEDPYEWTSTKETFLCLNHLRHHARHHGLVGNVFPHVHLYFHS